MSENSVIDGPKSRLADGLGARSGMILGQYELVRRIGSGGMAEVYEAVHRGLKKTVAIKVLLPDVAESVDLRARFLREGEAASRIQHPHVVDVTDVGEHDGVPFLVMELLTGDTLTRLIREHRQLSLVRTLDILLPIAAALSEAHRKGVVHRDLKPDNIFIARTSGGKLVPKLLDFGVSKMTTAGIPSETSRSAVLGTPHYMAPEQALGTNEVGARADQYAFALVVYECVTGVLPFVSENIMALLHEVSRGVQRPPSIHAPDLPRPLDAILLRALSADPRDRYADLDELTQELLTFASPRAADGYAALVERDPAEAYGVRAVGSEVTGDFERQSASRPRNIDEGAATVFLSAQGSHPSNEPPSASAMTSSIPAMTSVAAGQSSSRSVQRAAVAGLAIAAVGLTTWGVLTSLGTSESPSAPVPTVQPATAQPPPVTGPVEANTPPVTTAPPPLGEASPTATRIVVVAFPSDASLTLDGESVGHGSLDLSLVLDGTPHTLVVQAAGHQPQTVSFTTAPPPARIQLVRAHRPVSSMAGAGVPDAPPPSMRPPADEELRDSR